MRRLINLIILFKEYVVLAALIFLSFLLMAYSRTNEIQPLRAMTTVLVGSLQTAGSWIPNPFAISRENADLRDRNILMSSEIAELRHAKGENEELRKLLALKTQPGWKVVAADIVGKTTIAERNMMTISIGESSGIQKNMPVITDAGLVGRVFATSGGFSIAEGLFNTNVRIAIKTARTHIDGIVSWEGGDELLIRNIPKLLDVQVGDLIVTSEYSTLFPSDITVGTISRIEDERNSLFRRIFVTPAANPLQVEHCYVVVKDGSAQHERDALESRAADELKPQKKPAK
jgi:rod shape-determining protein MreC